MWDLQTLIALNRQRQEEYDKAHPREAAERIAEDGAAAEGSDCTSFPLTVPRTPGRTDRRDAPCEDAPTVQSELAGPLGHTLSLYLQ
jgi:hypothetical protein